MKTGLTILLVMFISIAVLLIIAHVLKASEKYTDLPGGNYGETLSNIQMLERKLPYQYQKNDSINTDYKPYVINEYRLTRPNSERDQFDEAIMTTDSNAWGPPPFLHQYGSENLH